MTIVNDTNALQHETSAQIYSTRVNSIRLFLGFPDASVPGASPGRFTDPVLLAFVLPTKVTGDPGALARGVGGA